MTQSKIPYEYATGDLLEKPNRYFYTPFHGADFLRAWREQREKACSFSAEGAAEQRSRSECPVERLIDQIQHGLSSEHRPSAVQRLDRLLQRFEVTKRLHGEYTENWRPVDPLDYYDMERYVQFGELLERAYAETAGLPFLNALLKCIDILTAHCQQLTAPQSERVTSLVLKERRYVEELMRRANRIDE